MTEARQTVSEIQNVWYCILGFDESKHEHKQNYGMKQIFASRRDGVAARDLVEGSRGSVWAIRDGLPWATIFFAEFPCN